MRDAVTLFEQNIVDQEVRTEHVRYTLALIDESLIDEIIEDLRTRKSERIIETLETFRTGHIDARGLFEQMLYRLRDLLIEHIADASFYDYQSVLTLMLEGHSKLRVIPDGMMLVEVTLLKIVKRDGSGSVNYGSGKVVEKPTLQARESQKEKPIPLSKPTETATTVHTEAATRTLITPTESTNSEKESELSLPRTGTDTITIPTTDTVFSFPRLIAHFRDTNPALMTDLKSARFGIDEQTLTLIFMKSWNHGRVNTPKVKHIITEALSSIFSGNWKVECKIEEGKHGNMGIDEVF